MSRGEIRAFIADSERGGRDWPRDPDGVPLYPVLDRELTSKERHSRMTAGAPFAWRLDVEAAIARVGQVLTWTEFSSESLTQSHMVEARPQAWGDVIVARRETPTSYHLSVVVDDALQGVSHVVRGMDLYFATSIQRLLQELLGLPQPRYFHHRLVPGADGRKLSKSQRDTGLAALREAGVTPLEIRRMIGLNGAPVPL
jgi:glutamyl-Q tRNA(Asp) synthetase